NNNIICFCVGIFFLILFAISFFTKINLNLLFIGLFLACNSILSDKSAYFEKVKAYNKGNQPCEVKVFKVNDFDKKTLLKIISPNYYSIFVNSLEDNKKIVKEEDIIKSTKLP
ncbi:MAG: hypothetical protein ACI4PF_04540, partial [Christensenellales bacterium]